MATRISLRTSFKACNGELASYSCTASRLRHYDLLFRTHEFGVVHGSVPSECYLKRECVLESLVNPSSLLHSTRLISVTAAFDFSTRLRIGSPCMYAFQRTLWGLSSEHVLPCQSVSLQRRSTSHAVRHYRTTGLRVLSASVLSPVHRSGIFSRAEVQPAPVILSRVSTIAMWS